MTSTPSLAHVEAHRRAVELIGAATARDEAGVVHVLGQVPAEQTWALLTALAQLVEHAIAWPADRPVSAFLAAASSDLDIAEARAKSSGNPPS